MVVQASNPGKWQSPTSTISCWSPSWQNFPFTFSASRTNFQHRKATETGVTPGPRPITAVKSPSTHDGRPPTYFIPVLPSSVPSPRDEGTSLNAALKPSGKGRSRQQSHEANTKGTNTGRACLARSSRPAVARRDRERPATTQSGPAASQPIPPPGLRLARARRRRPRRHPSPPPPPPSQRRRRAARRTIGRRSRPQRLRPQRARSRCRSEHTPGAAGLPAHGPRAVYLGPRPAPPGRNGDADAGDGRRRRRRFGHADGRADGA